MFIIAEPDQALRRAKIAACMLNIEMGVDAYHVSAAGKIEKKPTPHAAINLHVVDGRRLRIQKSAGEVFEMVPSKDLSSKELRKLHKALAKFMEGASGTSSVRCVNSSFHGRTWATPGRDISKSVTKPTLGNSANNVSAADRAIISDKPMSYQLRLREAHDFTWKITQSDDFGDRPTGLHTTNTIVAVAGEMNLSPLKDIPRTEHTITPQLFGIETISTKIVEIYLVPGTSPGKYELSMDLPYGKIRGPKLFVSDAYDSPTIPVCKTCGETILQKTVVLAFDTYCSKKCSPPEVPAISYAKTSNRLRQLMSHKLIEKLGIPTLDTFDLDKVVEKEYDTLIDFGDFYVTDMSPSSVVAYHIFERRITKRVFKVDEITRCRERLY